MAKKWTESEWLKKREQLNNLYIGQNKTIGQTARVLKLSQSGVFARLVRLRLPIIRHKKPGYNNINLNIILPRSKSERLAEFIGMLLGDGHISKTQVLVTLGKKDKYAVYVASLMRSLFKARPKIFITRHSDKVVYFGSVKVSDWLLSQGMAYNKTRAQIKIPAWIFKKKTFIQAAVRGLVDTDGSVYRLRYGVQISFTNSSKTLLKDFRKALLILGYNPSKISANSVYLTRKTDIARYLKEVGFKNNKHKERVQQFLGGSYSGNYIAL